MTPPLRNARPAGTLAAWMVGVAAAFQFLSIVPPLVRRPFTPIEMGRSVGWFPLVGIALGALLLGIDQLAGRLLPSTVTAALVIAAWVGVTGALHFDGLLDTFDGLFGGRTREARLRILSDKRVGAYAVAAGVLALLVQFAALLSMTDRATALLLAPVAGRWTMSLGVVAFPYAKESGLGRAMADHSRLPDLLLASAIAAAAVATTDIRTGAVMLAAGAAAGTAICLVSMRRLRGLTGDVYGAACVLAETAALVAACAA